ncbi:substrate-binding periplasmic protein [Shewanella sp.]|uniref:substrate-binding periplasmic protein n=1 Tax=Shewanella sp. TaxID=50422 RepID=UPI00356AF929
MKRYHWLFWITLVYVGFGIGVRASDQPLIFTNSRDEDKSAFRWLSLVYDEAFKRMNLQYEIQRFPEKRGEMLLLQGKVDGELARTEVFVERHPDLILVPVAVAWSDMVAYTLQKDLQVHSWEELAQLDLKVEYRRGVLLAESRLTPLIKPGHLSAANDWETGLKRLVAGRTDVFIDIEIDVGSVLEQGEFYGLTLYKAGALENVYGYPILHSKNASLAVPFEAVLRQMTEDGLIEKFRQQSLVTPPKKAVLPTAY